MATKIKAKPTSRLRNKFRFVILNDETFEEKFSLTLTRVNVWLFFGIAAFTLVFLTSAAIIYTPLKYFIPGFGDYNYRGQMLQLKFKTDSLENVLYARQLWLDNVLDIATGNIDTTRPKPDNNTNIDKSTLKVPEAGDAEKGLRKQIEADENFSLSATAGSGSEAVDEVLQMHLIAPVTGYVTDRYDPVKNHYGIDIAVKAKEPVKVVQDGKVIASDYTFENGYTITVQHANNLVSVYKHNASITKRSGTHVKAGEVIGFTGNTGENSTGPHLHFELWHEGKSLNPADYILF
jgi:murein DD-endopeptidase MepM/ murein hydrolase activator NlpD